jgi:hypothetical protein
VFKVSVLELLIVIGYSPAFFQFVYFILLVIGKEPEAKIKERQQENDGKSKEG